ncbi:MAG: 3D-(3,5/4)-trihydroxycyclohexane-1,2-dione acylhydrolase (decyclizing) [Promethearchaeota archaeon]
MQETINLTTAQALIRFLSQQYIEIDGKKEKFMRGIFGIFGHGQVCGIGQALEQNPEFLKYYRIQNEQAGVHTAIGAAKHLNRLGCFAVSSSIGPGATNMITGAATATINRIPVLLLPADTFSDRQPDPVLQQIEFPNNPSQTVNDCFKSVCKYWDRINRPEQIMSSAINAMRILTDPTETGAVCLALPQDVQSQKFDFPLSFFKERIHRIDRRPISNESLKIVIDKILTKKRPLIIAGGGIHYSLASETLKKFIEFSKIPVVFTNAGKSALPWEHPQNLGGMGVMGTSAANLMAEKSDLIISIGTRMMDFTTISKAAFQNPEMEMIGINISNFDAYKMDSIPILADAREALSSLLQELKKSKYKLSENYVNEYSNEKTKWNLEVDKIRAINNENNGRYLPQPVVIGVINDFLGESDVIVNAAGSTPGDLQRIWRSKGLKTYHLEYGNSCMGYEIAAGLGIKYVDPSREVYVIQGDGGYLMMHTEIVTSLMENKKITILLFDSEGFNSINNLSVSMGSAGFGNELRDRDLNSGLLNGKTHMIDYAANARSYGAKAYTVESIDELKDALNKAKKEQKTTLIHIKIKKFSQTHGYNSWWRVSVAETSTMKEVQEASEEMKETLKNARKY